jgi:sigma-70-like protein
MTDPFRPSVSPTLPGPTDWRAADIPAIIARLLALAIARTGDRDEAEDLVQETLIAAWQGARASRRPTWAGCSPSGVNAGRRAGAPRGPRSDG